MTTYASETPTFTSVKRRAVGRLHHKRLSMRTEELFLSVEVVWKDEHMLEVEVTASNAFFRGTTRVYDTSESLIGLANQLVAFPIEKDSLFYQIGEKDSYAYCSFRFYPISDYGLVGIHIQLEENVSTVYREEEKSKLSLELLLESQSIDIFSKQLQSVASRQSGKAILEGRG